MAKRRTDQLEFTPWACFYGAVLLLILPLRWLVSAAAAAAVHELCHYLAIRLCGGAVTGVRIGAGGIVMETTPLEPKQELICALAGPAGSLALLLFSRWIPVAALCGAAQGIFNLLPLFPMDGGRILRSAVLLTAPERTETICHTVEGVCLLGMLLLGLYGTLKLSLGLLPVLIPAMLLLRIRKIPCKTAHQRLQ